MKATVFGAGNIGRGLVGVVLGSAGFEVTYVDADADLVDKLGTAGQFEVQSEHESITVVVAGAINARDEAAVVDAIANSDIVATAVGPPILKVVAPTIASGLALRQGRITNVIACENVHPNSSALANHVAEAGFGPSSSVGFPDVVVDRIVPGDSGSLDVHVEDDFEFIVDRLAWKGDISYGTGMVFSEDLEAYKTRKLWLVNGLHAITAWLGIAAGHQRMSDAVVDSVIC